MDLVWNSMRPDDGVDWSLEEEGMARAGDLVSATGDTMEVWHARYKVMRFSC